LISNLFAISVVCCMSQLFWCIKISLQRWNLGLNVSWIWITHRLFYIIRASFWKTG